MTCQDQLSRSCS